MTRSLFRMNIITIIYCFIFLCLLTPLYSTIACAQSKEKFKRIYYNDNTFIDIGGVGGFNSSYVLYQNPPLPGPENYLIDLESPLAEIGHNWYSGSSRVFGKIIYNSKTNIVSPVLKNGEKLKDFADICIAPIPPDNGDICFLFKKKSSSSANNIRVNIDNINYVNIPLTEKSYTPLLIPLFKKSIDFNFTIDSIPETFSIKISNINNQTIIDFHKRIWAESSCRNIAAYKRQQYPDNIESKCEMTNDIIDINYQPGGFEVSHQGQSFICKIAYKDFCPVVDLSERFLANTLTLRAENEADPIVLDCMYVYDTNPGNFSTKLSWTKNEPSPCEFLFKNEHFMFLN